MQDLAVCWSCVRFVARPRIAPDPECLLVLAALASELSSQCIQRQIHTHMAAQLPDPLRWRLFATQRAILATTNCTLGIPAWPALPSLIVRQLSPAPILPTASAAPVTPGTTSTRALWTNAFRYLKVGAPQCTVDVPRHASSAAGIMRRFLSGLHVPLRAAYLTNGVVTTLAGDGTHNSNRDGEGTYARTFRPSGECVQCLIKYQCLVGMIQDQLCSTAPVCTSVY